ncbi:ParB/RepB/Spo0J family partition protein [Rubrivivax rivuli]|uniref:ParB/RepB/Spo0J family partition protein n=1 Tax=Rubrivivax rivuli TaxID=1862385 RepID=A0A437RAW1_9BURK|nr:ParB/RepB/Spo0J family partition protein [Rubrivivax rivuli]RVU43909.1 ParB/RepB/Spo0J family partition protein [Rubrivivax rivuli]
MSKKLAAKASLIQMPPVAAEPSLGGAERVERGDRADLGDPRPKTAPGSMALFMASQSAAVKEAEELRERLKAFDGALPVRALDAQAVRPSRWANRHEHSFADEAFAELKADIAAAGTNVQPVAVRALPRVLNGSTPEGQPGYELVFGHRRHRACLELGLPLQAMVAEMSDQQLFEAMERENRARKNLSAWEQGAMYRRALDEGLYPSQRRLAEALGVDVSLVSKSLSLARLPDAVVAAFPSPLDIQFRWAQPLAEALQKDPEGVLGRAGRLKASGEVRSAAQVLAVLVGGADVTLLNRSTPTHRVIEGTAGRQALMTRDTRGRVVIKFAAGALGEAAEAELAAYLEKLLSRR